MNKTIQRINQIDKELGKLKEFNNTKSYVGAGFSIGITFFAKAPEDSFELTTSSGVFGDSEIIINSIILGLEKTRNFYLQCLKTELLEVESFLEVETKP